MKHLPPPAPGDVPPPDPSADEPDADFALNGYLRLIGLQNQALRKLAAQLVPPAGPTLPLSPPGPPS